MGNQLFQEARQFVEEAKQQLTSESIDKAKNSLSSAYTNTTIAEKRQLRDLQYQLDQLQ
ncbi:hypothetical protein J2S13_003178 [Oikeobacillus pervagus]|uniref:DUF3813 domain-containing protein n=1 Tax=Oikeobacillus pervagus TaxID=1325931 RepID=A0AAJ1T0Z8_9BACI|nr:DUF3813 domain-containing protein [Oikeobacillus pervagus]MDQ0216694.1 hypothetical protein [Oikeobacillus pervagus]